jgi:uncharacterized protein YifE (UPF0438 family)
MFTVRTSREVFTDEELRLLELDGKFLEELTTGERSPTTPEQTRFVQVCDGEIEPFTKHEKVWRKYLERLNWESDPTNRSAMGLRRKADEGFGGSRDAIKEMRRAQWADLLRRTRE